MTDQPTALPSHAMSPRASEGTSGSRGSAALAWIVIVACCGWVIWEANRLPDAQERDAQPMALSLAGELTAKMMVGLADWSPESREMILGQTRALEQEGVAGQLARAVLAAEFSGLEAARSELARARELIPEHERGEERIEQAEEVTTILELLYAEPPMRGELTDEQRATLAEHLGWVGRFAPVVLPLADGTPQRDAMLAPLRSMPLVMMAFLIWLGVCLLGGMIALIVLLVLTLMGRVRSGLAPLRGDGSIYAEVFAVWAAVFVGGKYLAEYLQFSGLIMTVAVIIGGLLLALGWAVVRGTRWSDLRSDLGLHAGRGIVIETAFGFIAYCVAIPMLAIGLLMTLGLMQVQKLISPDAPAPGHPVQQFVAGGDWLVIAQTMALAAIIAPLVEETVFRGALYRHLRCGTRRWGLALSILFSAVVSSVLFAAIHPQGWPFIPVLSSLALAFCIAREWRGSVWPAMVAHGINNFVIMTLNVALLAR